MSGTDEEAGAQQDKIFDRTFQGYKIMNDFKLWFSTGLEHILDLQGYDHILFVALVTVSYRPQEWKKLLLLITGFTIGHSLSLALSVMQQLYLPQTIIELLIALTILSSAIYHLLPASAIPRTGVALSVVVLFGLIHGLGFSFLLRSMLGSQGSLALPLLYFNLGLEAGQLIIVAAVLVFSLFLKLFNCPYRIYKIAIACVILLISLVLSIQRFSQL